MTSDKEAGKPAAPISLEQIKALETAVCNGQSGEALRLLHHMRNALAAPSVEQDENGLAPTFGIPLYEDMRRALEHVECVYRLNFVKEGEPSSTLANLQRVIKRMQAESVSQDERGALMCERLQYRNEALSALLVDHSHAASAKDVDAVLKARDAIYSMFANVAQGAEAVHLDDWWVDLFAKEMKSKLANAREKGRGGWQDCAPADLSNMLRDHVEKGDPRDVANFCMFLWALRSPICAAPPAQTALTKLIDKWERWQADGDKRGCPPTNGLSVAIRDVRAILAAAQSASGDTQ
jgi:hypothetical protein